MINEYTEPWFLLGVAPNASAEDVNAAFKVRAAECHRMRQSNDPHNQMQAEDLLEKLIWAREMLAGPEWNAEREGYSGASSEPDPYAAEVERLAAEKRVWQDRTGAAGIRWPQCVPEGSFPYRSIPPKIRNDLLDWQGRNVSAHLRLRLPNGSSGRYAMIIWFIWCVILLVQGVGHGWSDGGLALRALISFVVCLIAAPQAGTFARKLACPLRANAYVTPLHLVRTDCGGMVLIPLWRITEMRIEPAAAEILCSRSGVTLAISVPGGTEYWAIESERHFLALRETVERNLARAAEAARSGDLGFFERSDPFAGAAFGSPSGFAGAMPIETYAKAICVFGVVVCFVTAFTVNGILELIR